MAYTDYPYEEIAYGECLADAYHDALMRLWQFGDETICENQMETSRQKEVSMTMIVDDALAEPMISRLWIGGPYDLERYRQELLDGVLDSMIGKGWDYTYHDRMVRFPTNNNWIVSCNQVQFVIDELKRCPFSRRAVISIRSAKDMSTDSSDPACLQHIQYFIRDGKLHCKVLFRSNDAVEATFMNAFGLIMLQKRIADALGIPVGSYVHRANSFHVYEKDWKLLDGYIERIKSRENLTYDYEGEFDEMMEEAKEDVANTVKQIIENSAK